MYTGLSITNPLLRIAKGVLLGFLGLMVTSNAAWASCSSPGNSIEAENCLAGTPQSQWDISGAGDPTIEGFATASSVNIGSTISFKVQTDATAYQIQIYRMGYYRGNGARLVTTTVLLNRR